jgi:hypothetical protein
MHAERIFSMTQQFSFALILLFLTGVSLADEPASADPGVNELVTRLVRENLPDKYEKTKNWGHTIEVWDGVHMSLDGARLKTKRKRKAVNHGTWTMYRAELVRPEELSVSLKDIRRLDDGRVAFDAAFETPLALFARLSEWQRGVQLISLSADCDARVRLEVTCAVRTKLETAGKLVPGVALEPEILSAKIVLEEFRLKRLSQLHGPLAKQLGEEAHDILQKEIDERNEQIVAKMNKQLSKQKEKLRLSLSDLAKTKFGDLREWAK